MGLNQEIRDLLASFNTPTEVAAQIADAMDRVERDGVAPGLAVGDKAPDFELPNAKQERVSLSAKLESGPVILSFFRGAWCPICNLQVAALHRALPEIREQGGSLVGVHPDSASFSDETPELEFDLLHDDDQSVIRLYRLQFEVPAEMRRIYAGTLSLDLSQRNADGSWSLPVPGTFVIDQTGVVRRSHVTADYTIRMEPEEALEALREIRSN